MSASSGALDFRGTCVKLPFGEQGGCGTGQACNSGQTCEDGLANGEQCNPGDNKCVSGSCVGNMTKRCRPANLPSGMPCLFDSWCSNGCDETADRCF